MNDSNQTLTFLGVGSAVAGAVALYGFLLLPMIGAGLVFLWTINLSLGRALEGVVHEPMKPVLVGEAE